MRRRYPHKMINGRDVLDAAVCAHCTTQVGNRLASVNAVEIIQRFSADSGYDSVTLTLFLHYKETECELAVLGPGLAWLRRDGQHLAVDGDAIRGVLSYPCRLIAEAEGLMGPEPEDLNDLDARDEWIADGVWAAMAHLLNVVPGGDIIRDWDDADAVASGVDTFTRPSTVYHQWGKLGDWRLTSKLRLL